LHKINHDDKEITKKKQKRRKKVTIKWENYTVGKKNEGK
jgi:hypothetical protein